MPYGKQVKRAINRTAKTVYKAAQKYVPKGTMAQIGQNIGAAYGAPSVGKALGQQFANLSGVGAYRARPTSRAATSRRAQSYSIMPKTSFQPRYQTVNSNEDLVVSRREYVQDLYAPPNYVGATPFHLESKALNPGLDSENDGLFSWLPQVAAGFSSYTVEKMVIQYHSTSGDATGANTALGSVFISANYQSTDNPPVSKEDVLNSQYAVSGPPSKDLTFPIECRPSTKNFKNQYVRTGPVKSNQNRDLFDFATVHFGTEGIPTSGQLLGEIWVTYQIRFTKFKTVNKANQYRAFKAVWFGAAGTGPTTNYPIGTQSPQGQPQFNTNNTLACRLDGGTGGASCTLEFPDQLDTGVFHVYLRYRFNTAKTIAFDASNIVYNNCRIVGGNPAGNHWVASNTPNSVTDTGTIYNNLGATTVSEWGILIPVYITGAQAHIDFPSTFWNTLGTTVTDMGIEVWEVNPLLAEQNYTFY